MKIVLEKDVCADFNLASNKEWLESNKLGAYAMSTVYGLNNQRYHGLYVLPVPDQDDKTIILSKFEESLFIENRVYELSTNQFQGGLHPEGYRYLKRFSIDPFPKFLFEVEGKRIEKTLFMLHDENTLVIRYAYMDQGPSFNMVLKPMIAARSIKKLVREISTINMDSYLESGVVKLAPRENIPELKIYYQSGDYVPAPLWYHNYLYEKDYRRQKTHSRDLVEDLFNPGFFTCPLESYDTMDLYISVNELSYFEYEDIYRKEKEYRRSFPKDFQVFSEVTRDLSKRIETLSSEHKKSISPRIMSFPVDTQTVREQLVTLFGTAILKQYLNDIKSTLLRLTTYLHHGILPDRIDSQGKAESYHSADISLLYIYLIYNLTGRGLDFKFIEKNLYQPCRDIIDSYLKGENSHITLEKDGLLSVGTKTIPAGFFTKPFTKQDIKRYGKLSEINALWYNALKIVEYFSIEFDKKRLAKKYASIAEKTKNSFSKKFWSTKNLQYYDMIKDETTVASFSLSQLFLIALPFSMLENDRGLYILKQIEEHLMTPFGLRSLSPNDAAYQGRINPSAASQSSILYQRGAIWPWMIGMYTDAVFAFRGKNKEVIATLKKRLDALGKFFYHQGLGNIPQYFEGNPTYRRHGQYCYALNITELFRALCIVQQTDQTI